VHHLAHNRKTELRRRRQARLYLSLEFLTAALFTDALNNMGLLRVFEPRWAISASTSQSCAVRTGCGARQCGLDRLAACFMESMATLAIPPSLRYPLRFSACSAIIAQGGTGISRRWLSYGNPWEFQRRRWSNHVHFGGGVEHVETKGRERAVWHPAETVQAVASDTPIVVGAAARHALRLWSPRSPDPLKLDVFTPRLSRRQRRGGARLNRSQVPVSE